MGFCNSQIDEKKFNGAISTMPSYRHYSQIASQYDAKFLNKMQRVECRFLAIFAFW